MILSTMTPEEKVKQMEKMKPLLNEAALGWMNRNHKIVFKTKVFPTFYTFERTFEADFPNLVKMVLREHHDAMDETVTDLKIKLDDDDRMYFEENEEYNRQAGFKNLITYSRNGISLGLSGANRRYFNFTTFVSNDMLKANQVEAQKECLKHQLNYRHKADLDPLVPQENIFKFVDPSMRGYGLNKKSKSTDK